MLLSFEQYQARYKYFLLPERLNEGWNSVRAGIKRTVSMIDKFYEGPDFIIKNIQLIVAIFSCFPFIETSLEIPRQFCKEARNFSNFIKGLKSIDGILHLQFTLKMIVLNVSGMTLFILSSITLGERLNLLNASGFKANLATLPVLGVLPFGGLLPLSILGLMGTVLLLSLDKKRKLEKEENDIKNKQLVFWSQSLDQTKVQQRQAKYKAKCVNLEKEVNLYEGLINEGEKIQKELNPLEIDKINACQKALQELTLILKDKQAILAKQKNKSSQWQTLAQYEQELENFRKAKKQQGLAKLNKVTYKKKLNLLSITINISVISRQAFAIGAALTGYGALPLPLLLNVGLELVGSGFGVTSFLLKKWIKKMEIPSVDLANYVSLKEE
jgi:hypothetical protein